MEEKHLKCKEDVEKLSKILEDYVAKAFVACNGNRWEMAKRLDISQRTVGNYCKKMGLKKTKISLGFVYEQAKPFEPVKKIFVEENFNDRVQTGYRSVTPEERDDWYNRDRF